jgi:hypothetical protein
VLAWWLGLAIFGGWIFAVSICLLKYAIPHQQGEEFAAAQRCIRVYLSSRCDLTHRLEEIEQWTKQVFRSPR